jgi:hypothetical protein
MSERSAQIRLMLSSGGLLSGLTQVGDKVSSLGARMGEALSGPTSKAFGAMGGSIKSVGGQIQNVTKFAVGLGGAFSLGEAAKEALGLEGTYKNLAFAIHAGTGEAVKWQSIQAVSEEVAHQWRRRNSEVAASFTSIYNETGSLEFTQKAIGAVGRASLETGKDMAVFAELAGAAYEKFGIGSDQIDEALGSIISFGNRGGLTIEEMASRIGQLGASAKVAGASGVEGLGRILGMSQMADDSLGNMRQKITAVTGLLDELSDPNKTKNIGKALHANLIDKKGNVRSDALDTILVKTGGDTQKLLKLFSGPTAKLMVAFGKMYQEGAAESESKDKKKQIEAGLHGFHEDLKKASKSLLEESEREKQDALKSGSAKSAMVEAMNELENAFGDKRVIGAMKTMAGVAPKLASATAGLLEIAVEHPVGAAAAYLGGKAALAGVQSLLGEALKGGAGTGKEWIGALYKPAFGRTRAVSIQEDIYDSMGMRSGSRTKTIQVGTSKLAAAGQAVGQAIGVALVAYAAYELGKQILDAALAADEAVKAKRERGAAIAVATSGGHNKEEQTKQLLAMRKQRDELQREIESPTLFESLGDVVGKGAAGFAGITGMATTEEALAAGNRKENELQQTKQAIKELEGALAADEIAKSTKRLVESIGGATTALKKLAPPSTGGSSHGPPGKAPQTPGHSGGTGGW